MVFGSVTVGLTPIALPIPISATLGVRILARNANSGNIYIGGESNITAGGTTTNLLNKGVAGVVNPYTLPPGWYKDEDTIYFVADNTGQILDWSAQ